MILALGVLGGSLSHLGQIWVPMGVDWLLDNFLVLIDPLDPLMAPESNF